MRVSIGVLALVAGFGSASCASRTPRNALALGAQSLERRQTSSRRYDTQDEKSLLSASAGLLQDLGFTIDNSATDLGLIVASKDRSAVEGSQVAGKIAVMVLLRQNIAIDKNQKIRACIVTKPVGESIVLRATFQRTVWNDQGQVSRLEYLDDPRMYQEFFEKLSKAVFLEANSI